MTRLGIFVATACVVLASCSSHSPPARVLAARVTLGSIFGTIDAGAGGKGSADLQDDHAHTWHRDADANGAYRFDGLAPGHYLLTLGESSAPPPCPPGGPCLGPASRFIRQDIQLAAGETHRADLGS